MMRLDARKVKNTVPGTLRGRPIPSASRGGPALNGIHRVTRRRARTTRAPRAVLVRACATPAFEVVASRSLTPGKRPQ
jgi:hypothetical protein